MAMGWGKAGAGVTANRDVVSLGDENVLELYCA